MDLEQKAASCHSALWVVLIGFLFLLATAEMIKFWRDQVIFTSEKHSRWWLTKTWRIVLALSEMSVQVQQESILLLDISPLFSVACATWALPCCAPGRGRTQPQDTSATSTGISHLLASFCLWYQFSCWADGSQHWDLGLGSCLPLSASLWNNN